MYPRALDREGPFALLAEIPAARSAEPGPACRRAIGLTRTEVAASQIGILLSDRIYLSTVLAGGCGACALGTDHVATGQTGTDVAAIGVGKGLAGLVFFPVILADGRGACAVRAVDVAIGVTRAYVASIRVGESLADLVRLAVVLAEGRRSRSRRGCAASAAAVGVVASIGARVRESAAFVSDERVIFGPASSGRDGEAKTEEREERCGRLAHDFDSCGR